MESSMSGQRKKDEGGRWSPLEDAKLCEQVAIHGCSPPKWKKIAKELPPRSRNSCRYRWEKLSRGQQEITSFRPPPPPPPMLSLMYPRPPYWNIMQWVPLPPPPPPPSDARSVMNREDEGAERRTTLWIPKPLRIDDPDHEAVKSSIWEALGIKNETDGVAVAGYTINIGGGGGGGGGGIFKAFQSKKKPSPPPPFQPNI